MQPVLVGPMLPAINTVLFRKYTYRGLFKKISLGGKKKKVIKLVSFSLSAVSR